MTQNHAALDMRSVAFANYLLWFLQRLYHSQLLLHCLLLKLIYKLHLMRLSRISHGSNYQECYLTASLQIYCSNWIADHLRNSLNSGCGRLMKTLKSMNYQPRLMTLASVYAPFRSISPSYSRYFYYYYCPYRDPYESNHESSILCFLFWQYWE